MAQHSISLNSTALGCKAIIINSSFSMDQLKEIYHGNIILSKVIGNVQAHMAVFS
jgi:hypothetical protein